MIDPASGPFLFDTSADSYFDTALDHAALEWLRAYAIRFPVQVSVITVLERMRGYALSLQRLESARRLLVETDQNEYRRELELGITKAEPFTAPCALIAAELMAVCPMPPSPPRRSHRHVESRQDRLSRWRFDILIAATALVASLPLIHNNPADFEFLRGAIERAPERFPGVGPLELISVKRLVA